MIRAKEGEEFGIRRGLAAAMLASLRLNTRLT
jgi:hypothetical protein